jgi:4-hydroxy-tetrahydrodipicolinate synthase
VNPYYNKPGQEGLYRHFATVAEAVPDLPIVLYNIPGRTGVALEPATVARLAKVANIVGIKEAAGSVAAVSDLREAAPRVAVLSGDDALTLPMMAVGARGVVSVAANVVPAAVKALVAAAAAGSLTAAREQHERLWPLYRALFVETNPIPVKAAAALLGHCTDEVRLPLTPATDATRERLRGCLRALGALA